MTIEQLVAVFIAGCAGLALGLVYFGGLWLTIRQLPKARRPVELFFISLILRSGIALFGFYLVLGNHWERAIACLVGFLLARLILSSQLRPDRLPPLRSFGSRTASLSGKETVS